MSRNDRSFSIDIVVVVIIFDRNGFQIFIYGIYKYITPINVDAFQMLQRSSEVLETMRGPEYL